MVTVMRDAAPKLAAHKISDMTLCYFSVTHLVVFSRALVKKKEKVPNGLRRGDGNAIIIFYLIKARIETI